jgi:predicted methyltransferase
MSDDDKSTLAEECQAISQKALVQLEVALEEIKRRDTALSAMDRNIGILHEIVYAANETLNEFYKITSTYHKKIIMRTATQEDIKECSRITRRSVKHFLEMQRLQKYYDKVCRTCAPKDISVIKR